MRVCRRLVTRTTHSAPGSSPNRSVTRACRPLKPCACRTLTATKTFRLPEKLSMIRPVLAPTTAARAACLSSATSQPRSARQLHTIPLDFYRQALALVHHRSSRRTSGHVSAACCGGTLHPTCKVEYLRPVRLAKPGGGYPAAFNSAG